MLESKNPKEFLKATKTLDVRKKLQEYGTLQREKDVDIWVKKAEYFMQLQHAKFGDVVFCITDVRYTNEIELIRKNNGLIIKVYAPNRTQARFQQENSNFISRWWSSSTKEHSSEKTIRELPDETFDYILDNDTDNDFIDLYALIKSRLSK